MAAEEAPLVAAAAVVVVETAGVAGEAFAGASKEDLVHPVRVAWTKGNLY